MPSSFPRRRLMGLAAVPALLSLTASVARPGAAAESFPATPLPAGGGFATGLLGACAAQAPDADALVAPSSAKGLLLMLAYGAGPDGLEQILAAFDAASGSDPQATLDMLRSRLSAPDEALATARALWLEPTADTDPGFVRAMEDGFGAEIQQAPLAEPATLDALNAWVAAATRGLVPQLLDRIPAGAQLVAIDALHFKAQWAERFDRRETRLEPFRRRTGEAIELPMMRRLDTRLLYRADDIMEAVELAYAGGRFVAVLLMARDEAADPVAVLASQGEMADGWLAGDGFAARSADLILPRLALAASVDLIACLRPMGIRLGVGEDALAFPGIGRPGPQVGLMLQKAVLRLDEDGTEAAAASAAAVTRQLQPVDEKVTVRFDRPFVLAIRDRDSGEITVAGAIRSPIPAG